MKPRLLRPALTLPARRRWGGAALIPRREPPALRPVSITHLHQNLYITTRPGPRLLWPAVWGKRRGALDGAATTRALTAFAGALLDQLLKAELDRQLGLLERGEGVEENRRRRLMLERRMAVRRPQGPGLTVRPPDPAPATPLVTERETHVVRRIETTERVVEQAAQPLSELELRRLAERVAGLVERRLRLERERRGPSR